MTSSNDGPWQLTGEDTSAVFFSASEGELPQLIWFGETLQTPLDPSAAAALIDLPLPMAKLDNPVVLDIFPQASSGIDCHPALRGHRSGQQFNHHLSRSTIEHKNNQLTIELTDDVTEIKVIITFTLHNGRRYCRSATRPHRMFAHARTLGA